LAPLRETPSFEKINGIQTLNHFKSEKARPFKCAKTEQAHSHGERGGDMHRLEEGSRTSRKQLHLLKTLQV
jgi:hypothetical protein